MSMEPNAVTLTVFLGLFALVTGLGFVASRWRAGDLSSLDEWGLGGRRFGTWVTWFLLGGDLYTAYTFIAVPALVFGAGAPGFFAVPYTILMFPLLFLAFPRLWSVSHRHGYVTAADFVRGRFGSRSLSLAVAATGIVATMPYIALQLVGMQVVLAAMGANFTWNIPGFGAVDAPLLIAFTVLAFYTYSSGLRAPALIAVVKDLLVYITVFAAIIYIPAKLGGYGAIFDAAPPQNLTLAPATPTSLGPQFGYATLALGSLLALFIYPHAVTGILSSSSRNVIRRNAMILPGYSLALALIAMLGYMAIAAGVRTDPAYAEGFAAFGNNFAVPALFLKMFPDWFVGVAFAAIAIGALVPAAIMSIACANLFTRNIYKDWMKPDCTPQQEASVAKIVSIVVKFGALLFVLELKSTYAIQLQLLGGIWMIQTLPAVIIALYTRWFSPIGLLAGWAAGMIAGTVMVWQLALRTSTYPLEIGGLTFPTYVALLALAVNIAVAALVTLLLKEKTKVDETVPGDYT